MPKTVKSLLKIGISAALLFLLLRQVDPRAIAAELAHANWWGVLAAFALFAFGIVLRAVRWKVLLDALNVRVPLRLLTNWYYIGAFFNTILPTGFGGDVAKAVALAQYSKQPSTAAGTVILDRFLGIVVLLGMGVLALPFAQAAINPAVLWFVLALFLGSVIGFWLFRQQRWLRQLKRWLWPRLPARLSQLLDRQRGWIEPLYQALQGYDRRTLGLALLASLAFNLTWVAVNFVAGWALGIDAGLADYLIFVPLVSLALLLPSFGGLGFREWSYAALFPQIGVPLASALALSFLVYAITVATGLIGGVLLLLGNLRGLRLGQEISRQGNK